ncbi:MFS transporter [Halonatronum saccharophilum]|uniref:MFS transporter n=1 Tax=Halonatronum saccharophilum TaxID=150060 RepID=UPI0004B1129B|nr:MFS transporter [Halonatronum saccharophilum]
MNKSNRRSLTVLVFTMMVVLGIIGSLQGQISPLLQRGYGLNNSQLGFALAFFSVGGIIASFFGGPLVDALGLKKVSLLAMFISIFGVIWISYVSKYYILIIVIFIIGAGLGIFNLSINSLASEVFVENKGRMMNLLHLFFGLGGIISPVYASYVLSANFKWEAIYSFSSIFLVGIAIFVLVSKIPKAKGTKKGKGAKESFLKVLKDPRVLIFSLMFLFHSGAEISSKIWLGVYLINVQGRSDGEVSFYFFLFFLFFTAGRLIASIIVEKVGYLRMVIISSLGAIVSITLGVVGPESFAIFFPLTGLFIASNFPTMQATIFEVFDDNIPTILGLTLTASSLGTIILGNLGIGFINDILGIKFGYGSIAIFLVLLTGLVLYLDYNYLGRVLFSSEGELKLGK